MYCRRRLVAVRADRVAGGNESLPRATLNFDKVGTDEGTGCPNSRKTEGDTTGKGISSVCVLVASIHPSADVTANA